MTTPLKPETTREQVYDITHALDAIRDMNMTLNHDGETMKEAVKLIEQMWSDITQLNCAIEEIRVSIGASK